MQRREFIGACTALAVLPVLREAGVQQPEVVTFDFTKRHGPVQVFDACGNKLKRVTKANLRTGEVERHVTDRNGKLVVDWVRKEVLRETVFFSAPLRYEFINAVEA